MLALVTVTLAILHLTDGGDQGDDVVEVGATGLIADVSPTSTAVAAPTVAAPTVAAPTTSPRPATTAAPPSTADPATTTAPPATTATTAAPSTTARPPTTTTTTAAPRTTVTSAPPVTEPPTTEPPTTEPPAAPEAEAPPVSEALPPGVPAGARPLGTFLVTCYVLQGTTASGQPVSEDAVAVDRSVIPLGTRLWIEGVGIRTALDTGRLIRGNVVDVWWPDVATCVDRQGGTRPGQVWVLD